MRSRASSCLRCPIRSRAASTHSHVFHSHARNSSATRLQTTASRNAYPSSRPRFRPAGHLGNGVVTTRGQIRVDEWASECAARAPSEHRQLVSNDTGVVPGRRRGGTSPASWRCSPKPGICCVVLKRRWTVIVIHDSARSREPATPQNRAREAITLGSAHTRSRLMPEVHHVSS